MPPSMPASARALGAAKLSFSGGGAIARRRPRTDGRSTGPRPHPPPSTPPISLRPALPPRRIHSPLLPWLPRPALEPLTLSSQATVAPNIDRLEPRRDLKPVAPRIDHAEPPARPGPRRDYLKSTTSAVMLSMDPRSDAISQRAAAALTVSGERSTVLAHCSGAREGGCQDGGPVGEGREGEWARIREGGLTGPDKPWGGGRTRARGCMVRWAVGRCRPGRARCPAPNRACPQHRHPTHPLCPQSRLHLPHHIPHPVGRQHQKGIVCRNLVQGYFWLGRDAEPLEVAVAERTGDGEVALHAPAPGEDDVPTRSLGEGGGG